MTVKDIIPVLDATVYTQNGNLDHPIETACGSDMMSDVLAFIKHDAVLFTGLNNIQVIRTAEMMDVVCVIYVRGKTPKDEIIEMADDSGITVLSTEFSMYEACGKLYTLGIKGGLKA